MQFNTLLGHSIFEKLGYSRDDLKWTIGIIAAVVLALAALGDGALQAYGIPGGWLPYIRLAAFVIGVVSASAKTSGLPSGEAASSVNPKNLPVVLLAAAIGLGSVTLLSSCSGTTQLPNLPQVQATADKDVRASIAKAYQLIGAALNVLDHADQYEATINKAGGIPANVHQAAVAGIVKAAKDLDAVNTDIGNKVLTTYAAIKARVDPIIANLNTLLNLTKSGGFDWGGLLAAAINLLMAVTNPGFGGSGLVPSVS